MASTATDDVGRSLKIKASTVRRIHKEYSYYQSELKKESDRVEGLKAAAADPHDLRQAESVLAESAMMIPDTRHRLEAAVSDLQSFLNDNGADVAGREELTAAKEELATVAAMLRA